VVYLVSAGNCMKLWYHFHFLKVHQGFRAALGWSSVICNHDAGVMHPAPR
jgi:hypothetical protein